VAPHLPRPPGSALRRLRRLDLHERPLLCLPVAMRGASRWHLTSGCEGRGAAVGFHRAGTASPPRVGFIHLAALRRSVRGRPPIA
jgi:hypothetical protein